MGAPAEREAALAYFAVTVTDTELSPALLRKKSEPVPGLPPWIIGNQSIFMAAGE